MAKVAFQAEIEALAEDHADEVVFYVFMRDDETANDVIDEMGLDPIADFELRLLCGVSCTVELESA